MEPKHHNMISEIVPHDHITVTSAVNTQSLNTLQLTKANLKIKRPDGH
jgi:hypothetical protein